MYSELIKQAGDYGDIENGKYYSRSDEKGHERCGDKGVSDPKRMVCFHLFSIGSSRRKPLRPALPVLSMEMASKINHIL